MRQPLPARALPRPAVADTLSKLGDEVQQHYREAADGYAKVAEKLAARRDDVAAALGGSKRRLHTLGGAMDVSGLLGAGVGAEQVDAWQGRMG